MQLLDRVTILSATDLNNFLACEHLTALDLQALKDGTTRPDGRSGQAALLATLGEQHEQTYLERLRADGRHVVEIARPDAALSRIDGLRAAAAATEEAMADGADVIYQATFFDGRWVGYADFLRRVDERPEGGRWAWHYEVEDTKLARHTEPYFLLQLCNYSDHVGRVQGATPRAMYVVLGDGQRYAFRVDDFSAYYRSVRARFEAALLEHDATYPLPVSHCSLCVWNDACDARRRRDDHLSGVAGLSRLQTERLNASGITTLAALGSAADHMRPPKMERSTFEKLRRQARLQDEQRRARAANEPDADRYEFIEDAPKLGRGFALLPAASPGDVFFDMEGDPYYDIGIGLEYLFGAYTAEDETFHAFWGCDRSEQPIRDRLAEKKAFEEFIDFIMDRRRRFPDMHVYHYASYEKAALQKLSLRHATREREVDTLLRDEVLVDLYRVVKQALVVGQPSYTIKKIEEYYGKRGDASSVKAGDDSILQFEEWLATRRDATTRNDGLLDDLAVYNRYDCVSTHGMREWLLRLRSRAEAQLGVAIPPYAGKQPEPEKEPKEHKYADLMRRLDERIPDDFDVASAEQRFDAVGPLFLARHMLEYHWREDKPVWWQFHDRCATYHDDPDALKDDAQTIIGLEPVGEPLPLARSREYAFRYPPQLHKLGLDAVFDASTKEDAGTITAIDDGDDFGVVKIKRGPKLANVPLPSAVTVCSVVPASTVLDAIARFAESLLDDPTPYRAALDVLLRRPPRLRGRLRGERIQPDHPDEDSVRAVCDALDDSYLFVQGPPGAGKTYIGARLIVDLISRGKRVGITANSHKAIHNLLHAVEDVARDRGVSFVGLKKAKKDDPDQAYRGPFITTTSDSIADDAAQLVAGTAWAFGPEAMDQRLDYVFIDEAGQVSLPAAIAVMTSARNVVLLGDPLQLSQVSHTNHPGNIGASVLQHLLAADSAALGEPMLRPIAPDRGILLTETYRMHPDVCGFISDLLYEGKLRSAPGREQQRVDSDSLAGTGLRYIPVEHEGNAQSSPEEARRIADEIEAFLCGTVTEASGRTRPARSDDVIVVAPYNAHVRCIRRELAKRNLADVPVGTVDKFQGREAYVVFFATAASTPEDASRGLSFVFDRQRFNVAVSRARALTVMVGSPRLRPRRCTSVEDVRVANGVCRFLEIADASRNERRSDAAAVQQLLFASV